MPDARPFDESYYAEIYCCIPNLPGQLGKLAMSLAGVQSDLAGHCPDPTLPHISFRFLRHYVDAPGPTTFTFEGVAHLTEPPPPALPLLASRVYVNAAREYRFAPREAARRSATTTQKIAQGLAQHLISPCSPLPDLNPLPSGELYCPGMKQCQVSSFADHDVLRRINPPSGPQVLLQETHYSNACHLKDPLIEASLTQYIHRPDGQPTYPPSAKVNIGVATLSDRPGLLAGVLQELRFHRATAPTYQTTPPIPKPWIWNNRYFRAYVCHNPLFAICELIGNVRLRTTPAVPIPPNYTPRFIRSIAVTPARDPHAWASYLLAQREYIGPARCELTRTGATSKLTVL